MESHAITTDHAETPASLPAQIDPERSDKAKMFQAGHFCAAAAEDEAEIVLFVEIPQRDRPVVRFVS